MSVSGSTFVANDLIEEFIESRTSDTEGHRPSLNVTMAVSQKLHFTKALVLTSSWVSGMPPWGLFRIYTLAALHRCW